MRKRSSYKAKEDLKLVQKAIENNDESAYAKMLGRYRDGVYNIIFKMVNKREEAEDLTIEAFGISFKKIHNYNKKYAFRTWLFKNCGKQLY